MPSSHRFNLQPYNGRKTRYPCPACGVPGKFTRYLDTQTDELLPERYGRCDRADKCGHHLSPYARPADGGLSYAIAIERGERVNTPPLLRPAAPTQPPPVLTIPSDVFTASLGHYDRNALADVLRRYLGPPTADTLLRQFLVGTSAYWPGACVFWLIDEQNRIRGGQVVQFDATGHTVKMRHPDGTSYRRTRWVHVALSAAYHKRHQQLPNWLVAYNEPSVPKSPCLFGLPQLTTAPPTAPVAIVESAKTAIVTTKRLPEYIWLATMGLDNLTAARLEVVRKRRIILFPDAGAFTRWQDKATKLRQSGFRIEVFDGLERLVTEQQRQAGIDLADLLLR
jgi:Domain of unknown function (DUF6371)